MGGTLFERGRKWISSHPNIVLGAIILLGFLIRLIGIQSRGIWYDDAFSILLSQRTIPEIISGTAADTMPPLSYFMLHFWMMIGKSIWFIRLLNVLLGLVVIWLAYLFGNEIADVKTGQLFAFFVAISPFQVFHAQEVRMYILLEIGLIGSTLAVYKIWKNPHPTRWDWVLYIFFGLIALYSHNLAIFTLIFVDLFLLLQRKTSLLLRVVGAQIGMLIGFLPWLVWVPGQIQKIQTAFWTPRPGLVEIIQAMDTLLGFLPQPPWLIAVLTIFSLQVVVMVFWLAWKNRHNSEVQFLLSLVLVPGILLFIASYLIRPVYVPRAMIASGVGFYGLAAYMIYNVRKNKVGSAFKPDAAPGIIAGLIVVISFISIPNQILYHEFPRSRFSELGRFLAERCPGETCSVIHDNKLSFFPTMIYSPSTNQQFLADEPGSFNDTLAIQSQKAMNLIAASSIEKAIDGHSQVFFITFQKAEDEYQANGKQIHPVLAQISNLGYQMVTEEKLGDINIYEFVQ